MGQKPIPITDENEKLTPPENLNPLNSEQVTQFVSDIRRTLIERKEHASKGDIRKSIDVSKIKGLELPCSIDLEGYKEVPSDEADLEPTFQEMLFKFLDIKSLSNVEFYKRAWLDKKLFSAINCNKFYQPKKTTAVACCFGLQLSLTETNILLKAAGYALSDSIKWDAIIKYCIKNKIYDIWQVNQILDELNEKCIGC